MATDVDGILAEDSTRGSGMLRQSISVPIYFFDKLERGDFLLIKKVSRMSRQDGIPVVSYTGYSELVRGVAVFVLYTN